MTPAQRPQGVNWHGKTMVIDMDEKGIVSVERGCYQGVYNREELLELGQFIDEYIRIFRPAPPERIGSIRTNVFMDEQKEWLIERVNAGMGEWEYVISNVGEYFATAPNEDIARQIVAMFMYHSMPSTRSRPAPSPEEKPCDHCDFQERDEREFNIKRQAAAQARNQMLDEVLPFLEELASPSVSDARKREITESLRPRPHQPKRSHDLTQLQSKSDLQEPVKVPQYERD